MVPVVPVVQPPFHEHLLKGVQRDFVALEEEECVVVVGHTGVQWVPAHVHNLAALCEDVWRQHGHRQVSLQNSR